MLEEGAEAGPADLDQRVLTGGAGVPDRPHDAAVGKRLAADPRRRLVGARAGPEQVDVRVDEAGDDAAAAGVDDPSAVRQAHPAEPAAGRPDPDDLPVAGGDRRLLQDTQRPLSLAGLAGHQLADAVNHQIGLDHGPRVIRCRAGWRLSLTTLTWPTATPTGTRSSRAASSWPSTSSASTGLAEFAELLPPRQATDAEVGLVHAPDYIELVRRLGHRGRR